MKIARLVKGLEYCIMVISCWLIYFLSHYTVLQANAGISTNKQYQPKSCYARFWLDLDHRPARLPARPSAQPCLCPRARPYVIVSHAPSAAWALYSGPELTACACCARPSVRPRKPRPVAIVTILSLYIDCILLPETLAWTLPNSLLFCDST